MNERLWDCHLYCLYRGFCNHMRTLPFENGIRVAKRYMAHLPSCFEKVNLRDSTKEVPQYSGPFSIHAWEYENEWVFQRDQNESKGNPLEYQFRDAPHHQILGSLVATALLYGWACAEV